MAAGVTKTQAGIEYQIPRNVLALLMLAQVVVVLPHIAQLSYWIVGVCLFCGYWRAMVYQGRWAYPPGWVKALLVVAAIISVAISGKGAFSVETASSLLVLAFALKLIEMKTRRDAYVVIFLSYFVIATEFLFSQSMGIAVYEVLACVMVTGAMVGLNQLQTNVRPAASLRLAGALLAQALPLTLVLFLFLRRALRIRSRPEILPTSPSRTRSPFALCLKTRCRLRKTCTGAESSLTSSPREPGVKVNRAAGVGQQTWCLRLPGLMD